MVEECDCDTDVITRRASQKKNRFGGEGQWNVELGILKDSF